MSAAAFGTPIRISATTTVATSSARLVGVLCNSSAAGTVTIHDAVSAVGTPFVSAIPMVAGAYTPIPASVAVGLHVVLGGTADVTLFVA